MAAHYSAPNGSPGPPKCVFEVIDPNLAMSVVAFCLTGLGVCGLRHWLRLQCPALAHPRLPIRWSMICQLVRSSRALVVPLNAILAVDITGDTLMQVVVSDAKARSPSSMVCTTPASLICGTACAVAS